MSQNQDKEISQALTKLIHNPLGYVHFAYPWGKQGTVLANETGPDEWQAEVLRDIGQLTLAQAQHGIWNDKEVGNVIQYAIKAGRDPGKTALIAWLIDWYQSTRYPMAGIVTANTKVQLQTTTWRELAKWWQLKKFKHWFDHKQERYICKHNPKTWFTSAVVWSSENPQTIAGRHEQYMLVVYDESSEIDDVIWEHTEGGLTDPFCLWIVAGNPTKTTGRFKECWGKFKHRWITKTIDSRNAKRPDKKKIQEWVEDYGEDSDFFKIWVKGEFPDSSSEQFVSGKVVDDAIARSYAAEQWSDYPLVMGVDLARHGDDQMVIACRQEYHLHPFRKYKYTENAMDAVGYISQAIREMSPQIVCIDLGYMPGVTDRLIQLGFNNVFGINFGSKPTKIEAYYNRRAEMWDLLKNWLLNGGSVPDDPNFKAALTVMQYTYNKGKLQLMKKKDLKAKLRELDMGGSVDETDATGLTFAMPVSLDVIMERKTPAQQIIAYVTGKSTVDWQTGRKEQTYISFGG